MQIKKFLEGKKVLLLYTLKYHEGGNAVTARVASKLIYFLRGARASAGETGTAEAPNENFRESFPPTRCIPGK